MNMFWTPCAPGGASQPSPWAFPWAYPYAYPQPPIQYPAYGHAEWNHQSRARRETLPPPVSGGAVLSGGLAQGSTYLYPAQHVSISVITGDLKLNNSGHSDIRRAQVTIASNTTVNEFILSAGGKNGWTMQEVYDFGGGNYSGNGIKIKHGSDGGKKTLKDQGFLREGVVVWLHNG